MSTQPDPTQTAKIFEFYVNRIWPIHRRFVGKKINQRCKQCGASEKMLSLNAQLICTDCEDYNRNKPSQVRTKDPKMDAELSSLFANYQNRGSGSYDALVMFSGGKDSTYLIRRLQTEAPQLRLLACSIDNGFMSPVAKENIDSVLQKLNVDHVFVRPRRDFYIKLFRYALTHLNAQGSYGTVDFSDGEFMLDSARNLAFEKKIPLILCGYSRYQVENGLGLNHFESPKSSEQMTRVETAGLPLSKIFKAEDIKKWWQGSDVKDSELPRLIFPLYVWDLEEAEIKQKVIEWGLISKKTQSPIVTNHRLIPLLGVVDVHQFGYSSFEKEFCRMIREGKAERKVWQYTFEFLEYTAKTGLFVKPIVLDLLKQLDLTADDVGIHFD